MKSYSLDAPVRLTLFIFIGFSVISYIWVVTHNGYNGDFMYRTPELSADELRLSLFYAVLPFFAAFVIYRFTVQHEVRRKVSIPTAAFGLFLVFLFIMQIFMALTFGVGQSGKGNYSHNVPLGIRLINLFLNRFNANTGMSLYIINSRKKDKIKYILIILSIILGISRFRMGGLVQLGFLFIICRYKGKIFHIIKKWLLPVIVIVFLFPVVVSLLYSFRSQLRGGKDNGAIYSEAAGDIVFGVLTGRLSSYSNTSLIMERKTRITNLVRISLPPWQLLREATLIPQPEQQITYGNVVLESLGNHTRLYSFMAGTPGALLIGYYHSNTAFFINLITFLMLIIMPFYVYSLIRCNKIYALVFFDLCNTLMSGSVYALSKTTVDMLVYILLFLCINLFMHRASIKVEQ
jgi:hypothetical protein